MIHTTWDALKQELVVTWANIDKNVAGVDKFRQYNDKYGLFVGTVGETEVKLHLMNNKTKVKKSKLGDIHLYYHPDENFFYYDKIPYYSRKTRIRNDNFIGDEGFLDFLNGVMYEEEYDGNKKDNILFLTSIIFTSLYRLKNNEVNSSIIFNNIFPYIRRLISIYCSITGGSSESFIEEIKVLHSKKNTDYTVGSEDPLINFMLLNKISLDTNPKQEKYDTLVGFLWRIGDKVSRIESFNKFGKLEVVDDPYQDAVRDFITYVGLLYAYVKRVDRIDGKNKVADERQPSNPVRFG